METGKDIAMLLVNAFYRRSGGIYGAAKSDMDESVHPDGIYDIDIQCQMKKPKKMPRLWESV